MSFWQDIASLLFGSVALFATDDPRRLVFTLLAGMIVVGTLWWVCSYSARLWNVGWHLRFVHHAVCATIALFAVGAILLFASMHYASNAALDSIRTWQLQINQDDAWQASTFVNAYDRVAAVEKFDKSVYPSPASGGSLIPATNDQAKLVLAETYADDACEHFVRHRPFLSRVIWANGGVAKSAIAADVDAWFGQTKGNYAVSQAVSLAASQIKASLDSQATRLVYLSRLILGGIFLGLQALPFAFVGYSAYKDLKVVT